MQFIVKAGDLAVVQQNQKTVTFETMDCFLELLLPIQFARFFQFVAIQDAFRFFRLYESLKDFRI